MSEGLDFLRSQIQAGIIHSIWVDDLSDVREVNPFSVVDDPSYKCCSVHYIGQYTKEDGKTIDYPIHIMHHPTHSHFTRIASSCAWRVRDGIVPDCLRDLQHQILDQVYFSIHAIDGDAKDIAGIECDIYVGDAIVNIDYVTKGIGYQIEYDQPVIDVYLPYSIYLMCDDDDE